jgi:hypothetical protein
MSDRDTTSNMGSSTETHITGSDETGTFITDEAPTMTPTAAMGSSNRGINTTGANRQGFAPDSSDSTEGREGSDPTDATASRAGSVITDALQVRDGSDPTGAGSDLTGATEGRGDSSFTGVTDAVDPVDLSRVEIGMTVVDSQGEEAGRVSAVQLPGTHARPDAPAGIAESMEGTGYLEVDGSGHLANDTYVAGYQIAATSEVVTLRVRREELIRVT